MITSKRQLIDEQTSPLHRIMWLYNADEPQKRTFENNICAFHIGNGYFLSVAHNLRMQAGYIKSIDEAMYQKEILYKLDGSQKVFMDQHYFTDDYTRKMYINHADAAAIQGITAILKQKRFDTRWVTLAEKGICNPHVVVQFRDNSFYNNPSLTLGIPPHKVIFEPEAKKYTFLLEVELIEAFYSADIALYRIKNAPQDVISRIPEIDLNFEFLEDDPGSLHCLQSSPNSPAGRLLNEAKLEGIMDQFTTFPDEIGGNYIFEGLRYLIKGYFRFGSSGAPYVMYDALHGRYVANAIQSEASGIQLSIKNDREGNFQYINAVASPLYLIKDALEKYL
ncbi:MAG: hypothetical protein H7257_10385 [Taibaiella sp.]|nr:hypothetical protein [Taibaiella sp.]